MLPGISPNLSEVIEAAREALQSADEAIIGVNFYDQSGTVRGSSVMYLNVEEAGTIIATTLQGKKFRIGRRFD